MPASPTAGPLRLFLRVLGVLVLLLAVAAGALAWWLGHGGAAWLDREAEAGIRSAIAKVSVPGYHITLGSLKADARHGSLVVTDADLDFEPRLLDSLRTDAFRYLFSAKVGRVEMRGLSFWRLLFQGEIRVRSIVLEEPGFHYYTGPKRVDLADPFKRIGRKGKGLVSVLVADNYAVEAHPATSHPGCCAALPLHEHCLFKLGVPLGELWWLTDLAGALAERGRAHFMLTSK